MSKVKKNRSKKGKIRRIILFLIILIVAGVLIFLALKPNKTDDNKTKKTKVVDTIDNFDYVIAETDTKLLKDEFKNSEVAKLFIIDFYTLDNKMSKNDVGGVQFVYSGYKTTFIDKARDEFYKYVKSNLNNDRNQELPEVASVTVNSAEAVSASSELSGDAFASIEEAYKVNISWTYKKDLGYQTNATIIVVKDNDKFSVAKLN